MDLKELEAALEGVLFAAGEPVGVERLCLGLETDRPTLDAVAQRLMDRYRYERRGIRLLRLDASYQLCSAPEQAECIRRTLEGRKPARLSQPALEVLAIIAYYQPVTRAYVDQIRGVDSAYTVGLLLERELIEESGRLAAHQMKFIRNLEMALVRIENKTYGICKTTGKLIPKERLMKVPHATECIEAKEGRIH